MTQTPFDQMSKQYLEEFLAPFGRVQRQYEVPGEAKFVDVWFVPDQEAELLAAELGILGRMVGGMCLLEPYRNAPTRTEVRTAVMKLIWVQEDERRKANQDDNTLSEDGLPKLWILATTTSNRCCKTLQQRLNQTGYLEFTLRLRVLRRRSSQLMSCQRLKKPCG